MYYIVKDVNYREIMYVVWGWECGAYMEFVYYLFNYFVDLKRF